MNAIQSKLLSGTQLADAEWELYLAQAHRDVQSMTPRAFGAYRTHAGLNSYEMLASVLAKKNSSDSHLLDLGCGDGYLIQYLLPTLGPRGKITGVDMVPSEIERAKAVYSDKRVQFLCARAQEIGLPPASVDIVFCHLTLMLMRPIEPVIAKLLQILKPGGELAGIVSLPRSHGTPAFELQELVSAFVDAKQPGMRQAFLPGDPRFLSEEGIQAVLAGFRQDLWIQDFEVMLPLEGEAIWTFYKDMYLIGALPPPARLELKERIASFVSKLKEKTHSFGFPLRLFQITR